MPGQARFLQVHDVFAAARPRPHENHPADNRWPFLGDLLSDHPAQRESQDVAAREAKSIQKR